MRVSHIQYVIHGLISEIIHSPFLLFFIPLDSLRYISLLLTGDSPLDSGIPSARRLAETLLEDSGGAKLGYDSTFSPRSRQHFRRTDCSTRHLTLWRLEGAPRL